MPSSQNETPSSKSFGQLMQDLFQKYQDRMQARKSFVLEGDWSRPPTLDIRTEEQMAREDPGFKAPRDDSSPRRRLAPIRSGYGGGKGGAIVAKTHQPSEEERRLAVDAQAAQQAGMTLEQYQDQQRQLVAPDQQRAEREAQSNEDIKA